MRLNEREEISNRELKRAAIGATSFSDLRLRVLSTLAQQGVRVPTWDASFEEQVHPAQASHQPQAASPTPVPVQPDTCVRTIYPHDNDRMEIFGKSEAELDLKESQIRALYGKR